MKYQRHPAVDYLHAEYLWNREEENDINAIRPPDDEAFLDENGSLLNGDLLFSDGFPNVADDDTKSGRATHTRQPYRY